MSTPYETKTHFTKTGGTAASTTVSFPSRVFLQKLLIVQETLSGSTPTGSKGTDAFTVDVFNIDPALFGTDDDGGDNIFEENHLVCPRQTASSGVLAYYPSGIPFFNMDEPDHMGNQRKLYVRVNGAHTGRFHITVAGESDVG